MKHLLAIILLVTAAAGCRSTLQVRPVDNTALYQEGIIYRLPTTRLKLTVPYALTETRVWNIVPRSEWEGRKTRNVVKTDAFGRPLFTDMNGAPLKLQKDETPLAPIEMQYVLEQKVAPTRRLSVKAPITLAPLVLPDSRLAFRVAPGAVKAFGIASNKGKFMLGSDGLLQGFNLELNDRKAEVLTSFIKSTLQAAKIAGAVAGRELREETIIKTVEISRELRFEEFNAEKIGDAELAWRLSYTLALLASEFGEMVGSKAAFEALPRDHVIIEAYCDRDLKALSALSMEQVTTQLPWQGKSSKRVLPGLLYRIPASVEVKVRVNETDVLMTTLCVAQAGGLGWTPIHSRLFSERQFGFRFSETSGGVTEMTFGNSSGAVNSAVLSESATSAVAGAIKDIDNANVQRQVDALKKQKELLELQQAIDVLRGEK